MKGKSARVQSSRSRTLSGAKRTPRRTDHRIPSVNRRFYILSLVAIACISSLLYINTLHNELVYDDLLVISNNPVIQNPWDFKAIWQEAGWLPNRVGVVYRPLSVWILALNYRMNELMGFEGDAATSYHILNILLHAGASCVLLLFLLRLPIPAWSSLTTALLFAAHPIHTEAVAGIVGRAEILAFIFGMAMLILHRHRQPLYICAPVYLLAIWSKESAVAFFPLAIATDILFRHPHKPRATGAYMVYAGVVGFWFVLRLSALGDITHPVPFIDNPIVGVSLYQRLLTVASTQLEYLRLHVFPVPLSSDYSYNQLPIVSTVLNLRVLIFIVILSGVCWTGWTLRKRYTVVSFAVLGYAILFGATSNILLPIGTIMGERLTYAPSFGICLLFGYGVWWLRQRYKNPIVISVPVILGIFFAVVTVQRNQTWKNEPVFFQKQVETAPRSAKAHYNLGSILAKLGDDQAAIQAYETALKILPFYPEPLYNMGNTLRRLNAEPDRIIDAYRGAIEYDRGHRKARANLAEFLLDHGRYDEAKVLIEELKTIEPEYPSLEYLQLKVDRMTGPPAFGERLSADVQQGILAFADGNHDSAIGYLERAFTAGAIPANMRKTTFMLLVRSFEAVGQPDRAEMYQLLADSLGTTKDTLHR